MKLEVRNLDVVYGNGDHAIQALEEINLRIGEGECLALVGESGSGKTTLGMACLGLLPGNAVQRGGVYLNGRKIDPGDEKGLRTVRWKDVSMVFQNGAANLNPSHRIIDQVAEPLMVHGGAERDRAMDRAAELLSSMGLPRPLHERYPHRLSGGEAQRVLLAMAMILDPGVLILDEPTSALDVLTKGVVSRVIEEGRSSGKAVLLITHDLEFVVRNAGTVAVLYLGQIMETLPAGDLLSNPLHPYTLALVKSYPFMETARDLGGIRGDAFYRTVHQHGHGDETSYSHSHIHVPESSHCDGHAPPAGCLFRERCTQAVVRCGKGRISLQQVQGHQVRCVRRGIARILELKGVGKSYGSFPAVRSVDLGVRTGELFSLVGETGSGKTTLAMLAAGIARPDSGFRLFEGLDMDQWARKDYKSLARRIGVIYQNPAESVSHRFSVLEIVSEPLVIHENGLGREERERRVRKALSHVHLSTDRSFLDRYPHELNMGALQRVCLARALVLEPRLLIADEPTSSLDPSVQAKVLKLLLDLQIERGLSMIFVSHDIGLVRKVTDRIGVMLHGSIVEMGPASSILSRPSHPYTRLLIDCARGSSPPVFNAKEIGYHQGGCPFSPRCEARRDRCLEERPSLRGTGRVRVACHFPLD